MWEFAPKSGMFMLSVAALSDFFKIVFLMFGVFLGASVKAGTLILDFLSLGTAAAITTSVAAAIGGMVAFVGTAIGLMFSIVISMWMYFVIGIPKAKTSKARARTKVKIEKFLAKRVIRMITQMLGSIPIVNVVPWNFISVYGTIKDYSEIARINYQTEKEERERAMLMEEGQEVESEYEDNYEYDDKER